MMFEEDLINSVIRHLSETRFTSKDTRDGATQETRAGVLTELFSGMSLFPAKLYDLEDMPVPSIAVAADMNPIPQTSFFGQGNIYHHGLRLLVTGTVRVNGEEDFDAGMLHTMQLRSLLTNHFDNGVMMDWYRYAYDASGTATKFGQFYARDLVFFSVDDNRFVCQLTVEVGDGDA